MKTKIPKTDITTLTRCALPVEINTLRSAPEQKPLTKAEQKDLLHRARLGEPIELYLDAVVYLQSKAPRPLPAADKREANDKCVLIRPGDLERVAKSFRGLSFLRDHNAMDLLSVGGEIAQSELGEKGGRHAIFQTLHLVSQWAVVAALEGILKTFSIHWGPKPGSRYADALYCTVCGNRMMSRDCEHWLGAVVTLPGSSEKVVVEGEWRGVQGSETSAVAFPAVRRGTGIEEIRAVLTAAREEACDDAEDEEEIAPMPSDDKLAEIRAKLAAAEEERDLVKASLAAIKAEHDAAEAIRRAQAIAIEKAAALASGLMITGSKREAYYDMVAARSAEEARDYLATLDVAAPVGQPMQTSDPAKDASAAGASDEFAKVCREQYLFDDLKISLLRQQLPSMGLTEEQFLASGEHNYWEA